MKRKDKLFRVILATLFVSIQAGAQSVTPDLQDKGKWRLINRTAELINEGDKIGIRLSETPNDGVMFLNDLKFGNGTIELDIKGKNVLQQSFVGVAFHAHDAIKYDAIYFRPFNFVSPDTARQRRAVHVTTCTNNKL